MEQLNQSTAQQFILLGLSTDPDLQIILFLTFLIIYLMNISGNLLLITIVRTILAVMAYDRFAAICRPLHYNTIMNNAMCFYLAVGSWSIGFINSLVQVNLTFQLSFCQCVNINHYFCEAPALLRMACGDTFLNELSIYISGAIIAIGCFSLTLISYVYIISNILKISSSLGRQKSWSTCASHLTVISLYYGTVMFMYLRPHSKKYSHFSSETDTVVPILYTAVTPMLNPFIYSVRNKDVKNILTNQLKRKQCY